MLRTPVKPRQNPDPTNNPASQAVEVTLPAGKLLKRAEAARRLGVSTSSVRRMEGTDLQPIVGPVSTGSEKRGDLSEAG